MATGQEVGLLEGVVIAVADELYEMSGTLMARTAAQYTAGDTSVTMETTDRFSNVGRLSLGGEIAFYASKTDTTFDGLTDEDGNPGIDLDLAPSTVVVDITKTSTQLDGLRQSFIVTLAEDRELDILARNYGLLRPRGLLDPEFRDLLRAIIFGLAQTIKLIEDVLDILVGPGLYTIYEDLESFPHTVFIVFPLTGSDTFKGKSIFVGGELQSTGGGGFTVTVDNPVSVVYGIYASADLLRVGTNFALLPITVDTSASFPTRVFSPAAFSVADDQKAVFLDGIESWKATFISAAILDLQQGPFDDGITDGADPDEFVSLLRRFSPWMIGHKVDVLSGPNAAGGPYTITAFLNPGLVEVTPTALVSDTNIDWRLIPSFTSVVGRTLLINRSTFTGDVITSPVVMPATVLVDYTHAPSAQAMQDFSFDGNDQFPFYLWDEGFLILFILDLITAAGVRVVLVPE